MSAARNRRTAYAWIAGGAAMVSATLWSDPAAAAPPVAVERAATDGVERPIKDISGQGDASSIELNPALISAVRGLDLVVRGYRPIDTLNQGGGFGAWLSANFGWGIATAIGVQALRPSITRDRNSDLAELRQPDLGKVSLAISGGSGKVVASGLGLHFVRGYGRWLERPDLDWGVVVRATNYVSFGASLRWSPGRGQALPLGVLPPGDNALAALFRLRSELSVRPLGTRTLEFAGGADIRAAGDDDRDLRGELRTLSTRDIFAHGRLAFRWAGLAIQGEIEQVPLAFMDPATFQVESRGSGLRGGVSVDVAWDFVSAGMGLHTGFGEGIAGVAGQARMTTLRQGQVVPVRRIDAERLVLGSISDQRDLIEALERIHRARDAGARAILVLDAREASLGWAGLLELREALIEARNAGVHVFAWLESASTREYYVASVAERIFIHPAGELRLLGLKSTAFYFEAALAKVGVRVEALHAGAYKSANEPFTRTSRSPEDRAQQDAILDDTYAQIVDDVARARQLARADVRDRIDVGLHGPDEALDAGLVDAIAFRDELLIQISDALGVDVAWADFPDTAPANKTWSEAPYIAVLLIEGTIVDGVGGTIPFLNIHLAGGDSLAKELRALRRDRACKGIVVRVDSPGGSALASDMIWREIDRTRNAHEQDPRSPPIVVSMGDVAASGGYYVAVGAPHIIAEPTTVTGSIGVIALHFDVSGLLAKLGVATDTLQRGQVASLDEIWSGYDEHERAAVEASIERTYRLFLSRVAEGRGKPIEAIEPLAGGRVWSGADALAAGLVDELGGLDAAIRWVRREADIGKRRRLEVRVLPKRPRLIDLLLRAVDPTLAEPALKAAERRRARRRPPPALDRALARLPLSVLYLHDGRAAALMPAELHIEP